MTTSPSRKGPRTGMALVAVVVLGVAAWFGFRAYQRQHAQPPAAPVAVTELPKAAEPPPAVKLTDGDALVRKLGALLSPAPEVLAWLGAPDILRRLVAGVNLVAEGNSPRPVLGFLAPGTAFEVERTRNEIRARPATYARFNRVTEVVTAVDPVALATHLTEVETFANAALGEIAKPGALFRDVLRRALAQVDAVDLPRDAPLLVEKGAGYAFADPRLESLTAAQKCLLRLGPGNAQTLQAWTRKLDEALAGASTSARPRPSP